MRTQMRARSSIIAQQQRNSDRTVRAWLLFGSQRGQGPRFSAVNKTSMADNSL